MSEADPESSPFQQHIDRVRRYYQVVDAGDIESLIRMFDEHAVYHRPGYRPIRGRDALEEFYRGDRIIESGSHTLTEVIAERARVAVNGGFAGLLKDGRKVDLRFADFFVVSGSGLFQERETFFFAPMV